MPGDSMYKKMGGMALFLFAGCAACESLEEKGAKIRKRASGY
jgi:hypothetical protein